MHEGQSCALTWLGLLGVLLCSGVGVAFEQQLPGRSLGARRQPKGPRHDQSPEHDHDFASSPRFFGPTMPEAGMVAALEIEEIGLVLEVGPSAVAPGGLGLFVRTAPGIAEVELPELTLLAGYAEGSFKSESSLDDCKTVGFALPSGSTAVFFRQTLMSVGNALTLVTEDFDVPGKLAGHEALPDASSPDGWRVRTAEDGCKRFFVPTALPSDRNTIGNLLTAKTFGQFCNDRAFVAGTTEHEYSLRAAQDNHGRLAWRLEYDAAAGQLVPSWPLLVLSRASTFANPEPMELGTTYGWRYWVAAMNKADFHQ